MNQETKQPLVSVIMPCYKMGRFIGEALESVGAQTYTNWEVIAVDDCGPDDGTREVVEAFAKKFLDHRIIYHRHEKNGGVSAARNTAINLSQGEFLAFLDPDDIWFLKHLEKHIEARKRVPEPAVTASGCRLFDTDRPDQTLGEWSTTRLEAEWFPRGLVARNSINPSAVVAKRVIVVEEGGFDESPDLQHVEDWDLWLRLGIKGVSFSFLHELTVNYRRHSNAAALKKEAMKHRINSLYQKHKEVIAILTYEYICRISRRVEALEDRIRQNEMNLFVRLGRFVGRLLRLGS